MTFTAYLLIGAVVYIIVTGETLIREGWSHVKTKHSPGWVWITDIISVLLLWPFVVLCYGFGMVCRLINELVKLFTLKTEL